MSCKRSIGFRNHGEGPSYVSFTYSAPAKHSVLIVKSVFNVKAVGASSVIMKTNGLFAALVKKSDLGNMMLVDVDAGKFSGLRAEEKGAAR